MLRKAPNRRICASVLDACGMPSVIEDMQTHSVAACGESKSNLRASAGRTTRSEIPRSSIRSSSAAIRDAVAVRFKRSATKVNLSFGFT